MAKMSFMQYFALFLIISVVLITNEIVAHKICVHVAQPSNCGFDVCKVRCGQLFNGKLAAAECIIKSNSTYGANQLTRDITELDSRGCGTGLEALLTQVQLDALVCQTRLKVSSVRHSLPRFPNWRRRRNFIGKRERKPMTNQHVWSRLANGAPGKRVRLVVPASAASSTSRPCPTALPPSPSCHVSLLQ
ncbi:hypothetical protein D0Y65_015656 [Glycine soja]|uniref:Uncharacterized protein n=1 Tax=Glycine soja TaxID=3848 RepID=A0A445KDW7_GLYSO|nr:hypothetical protein D0Y65_015656 [Glycine soja]